VGASYNYGTLPFFTTTGSGGSIDPVKSQLNAFTLPARAQYNTGVNLLVPLEALSSRRNLVHKQELILQQAAAERKMGESEIRREVIVLYQSLTLAKANLQHYQDAVQSASISKKLADTKFRGGEIQIDEQMAAMDLYSKAVLAQEEAKNKYQTALLLLEDLVGKPLNQLLSDK
jgi:outer membrane protein TolC